MFGVFHRLLVGILAPTKRKKNPRPRRHPPSTCAPHTASPPWKPSPLQIKSTPSCRLGLLLPFTASETEEKIKDAAVCPQLETSYLQLSFFAFCFVVELFCLQLELFCLQLEFSYLQLKFSFFLWKVPLIGA